MMMRTAIAALALVASAATAQTGDAPDTPGVIGAPAGTGALPAVAEARADAPGYTLYRPARLPRGRLPLVLWGNGGCRDNGLSASHFLREMASHGYIVVANGAPRGEQPVADAIPVANGPTPPPPGMPTAPDRKTPDETRVSQLLAAIDWIKGAAANRNDPLYARVDTTRIAVMGHSCGGLQALAAGADPRIDAVVAFASGVYVRTGNGLSGVTIAKDDLLKLHTPVAYVLGGPTDVAYPNGMDDFSRIAHVPVMAASLPVGHGGTFRLANGGEWAQVGAAWLDWQLKHDRKAAYWFVGADCRLCADSRWTVQRKQFPEKP